MSVLAGCALPWEDPRLSEDTDASDASAGTSGDAGSADTSDTGGGGTSGGELPSPEAGYDFDCVRIDRVQGPKIVPPAGLQVGFRVLDCNGDPIPALTAADVQVINDEKGGPFGAGGEGGGVSGLAAPASYGLVSVLALDMSDSIIDGGKLDDVIDGALTYLDGVEAAAPASARHELAIVTFGRPSAFTVVQEFTTDLTALRATLEQLRGAASEGSTDLYGSYVRALELAQGRGTDVELAERFVVVLTDGTHEAGDEAAMRDEALAAKAATNAHVFAIGIDGAYDPGKLAELATTAESFVRVDDTSRLQQAFERIAGRVEAIARSNYVVGVCTPIALGSPSLTIAVEVAGSEGSTPGDAVQLRYDVTHLDGNTAACDAEAIADARLRCDGGPGTPCTTACGDMECGCDGDVVCGTCPAGSQCGADGRCELGEGPGPGDLACLPPRWASGVTLGDVVIHQGTTVALATGGVARGTAGQVVAGRDALVRAELTTAAGFVPRALRAELRLEQQDGRVDVFVDARQVSASVSLASGAGALQWRVPAELVREGARWQVQVLEGDPDAAGTAEPVQAPAAGPGELGAVAHAGAIRVEFVPIRHQVGTCSKSPNMNAAVEALRERLAVAMPLHTIELGVRAQPFVFGQALDPNAWVTLVGQLSAQRASDGVDADVFWYGVVDPCGSTAGIGGIGYVPRNPTAADAGPLRTSVGLGDGWIFVHELGHNLGRYHVGCSGGEANTDSAYPHAGGAIGAWGWDAGTGALVPPTHRDFMSYCADPWVSDYGWARSIDVLEGIAGWAAGGPAGFETGDGVDEGDGIMAVVDADGGTSWWADRAPRGLQARAHAGDVEGVAALRLVGEHGQVREVAAQWGLLSDDRSMWVRAAVPALAAGERLMAIEPVPTSGWPLVPAPTRADAVPGLRVRP